MKVFSRSEIKFLEQCAVDSGLGMKELMEKAGSAVAAFILRAEEKPEGKRVLILCGKGNNGGDGFVTAAKLIKRGMKPTVVFAEGTPATELAKDALSRMPKDVERLSWPSDRLKTETAFGMADYIVDAVYGFGFHGEIKEPVDRLIALANAAKGKKIAVDIPSGAECDSGRVFGECFKADTTLCFTAAKPACVLQPAASYCGKLVIAPVGIDKSLTETLPPTYTVLNSRMVADMFELRKADTNKGSFGRLLMICGSYGMAGACIMAAKAALRSGVGLLDIALPESIYPIVAPVVPEAIFTVMNFEDEEKTKDSSDRLFASLKKASACLVGPGLGKDAERYVSTVLKFASCPIILDADGLNYISQHIDELKEASAPVILTPHPGEMARLLACSTAKIQLDRATAAKSFSREHGVFTVLKGSGTLIVKPDGEILLNVNGNPGMATGGSGDVLAGIIASLSAQGMSPINSAAAGVFIHGRAGDICAEELSEHSMLPTDIIDKLPVVFKKIENRL